MGPSTTTTTAAAFLLLILSSAPLFSSSIIHTNSISPNFTGSYYQFIDQSGVFLFSLNSTFQASISNPQPESTSFYLTITHVSTKTVIWAANRDTPISKSSKITLSLTGITIFDDSKKPIWSTPQLNSPVSSLRLLESGNLVLLDQANTTLWQSFDHPTDTIVIGQRLPVGKNLTASVSDGDLAAGDYELAITADDAVLQWNQLTYWKLSMETKAFKDSNLPVSYMGLNNSGLYLFTNRGSEVAIQVILPAGKSDIRIAKLGQDGHFNILSLTTGSNPVSLFSAPDNNCDIPFTCRKIGLCNTGSCSCPPGFKSDAAMNGECTPTDRSLSLPGSCAGGNVGRGKSNSTGDYSYISLSSGMDYFSNGFTDPVMTGVTLSRCKDLCTANCSCLGVFFGNSSGSCYLLENNLGSIMSSSDNDRLGFIKVAVSPSDGSPVGGSNVDGGSNFPIAGLVLLPACGVLLVVMVAGIVLWRRRQMEKRWGGRWGGKSISHGDGDESSGEIDFELFSIPGLPVRFQYEELHTATEGFKTSIGSGGFGTVYKGTLKDKTVVAVKKITNLGVQGKREFCTEIAIIGNVHHVNLVKLRGFCARGRERFLVYEYMNRGSLDRTLFGSGPVLEWQERFDIALGTARGLAYLHSGCDHKIIHCDVKPENILLHDNMQVKISDFGLSKLLTPEQSGLFTTMRGTRGYLAPEWLTSSTISDKTDVYSYGMVLLEIVRGRKNCAMQSSTPATENGSSNGPSSLSSGSGNRSRPRPLYFPLFALEMHEEGRYLELVEPRLEGRVSKEEVEKLVKVALCCVHEEPMLRPSMANVVGMLEGVLPVRMPRLESLNFLRFYGRRFNESSTIGGETEQIAFCPQGEGTNSSTSTSFNSYSYMSSQQVSGPR